MNATDLTLVQRGERIYSISRKYRYLPWRPTSLFSHIMREAIVNLSTSPSALDAISNEAARAFMSAALQPGLDVPHGVDSYKLSQDLTATMRTVLEYLSRGPLLSLHPVPDVAVLGLPWSFINPRDDTGTLHRFVFTDSISDDTLYHHARGWECFADQCINQSPLTLHLINIGRTVKSRRYSPWCRVYSSPTVANVFRFQHKDGTPLDGAWKPLFFADSTRNRASTWVDLLTADNVLPSLVRTVTLPEPSPTHRASFLNTDLLTLSSRASSALTSDPFSLPMCRTSCSSPFPCPHEHACYSSSPSVTVLENSGLYAKLPALTARQNGSGIAVER